MSGTSAIGVLSVDFFTQSISSGTEKIGKAFGYTFRALSDIIEDREALVKFLKMTRHTIAAYAEFKGHRSTLARIDADWEVTINLLEGVGFIAAINTLFFEKTTKNAGVDSETVVTAEESKKDLLERVADWTSKATTIAFCTADILGGIVWMLALEIPVLGPFSEVKSIVVVIGKIADGAALTGFGLDAVTALRKLANFEKLSTHKKQAHLLRLAENTTAATAIVFGFVGVTCAPLTIGAGIAASTFGVVRFLHKRQND